jgi:hypothetical protein
MIEQWFAQFPGDMRTARSDPQGKTQSELREATSCISTSEAHGTI